MSDGRTRIGGSSRLRSHRNRPDRLAAGDVHYRFVLDMFDVDSPACDWRPGRPSRHPPGSNRTSALSARRSGTALSGPVPDPAVCLALRLLGKGHLCAALERSCSSPPVVPGLPSRTTGTDHAR